MTADTTAAEPVDVKGRKATSDVRDATRRLAELLPRDIKTDGPEVCLMVMSEVMTALTAVWESSVLAAMCADEETARQLHVTAGHLAAARSDVLTAILALHLDAEMDHPDAGHA